MLCIRKVLHPSPGPSFFYPAVLLPFQAHLEYLNFLKYTRSRSGCAHARAPPRWIREPRGPAAGRAHSILRARAHPSAEGIGRAHPARPGETPERLRRLPVPTAVKTSLPSLSQPSGAEAAAALPEVCARLSAGRWPVRGAAGPGCCPSQAARVRASEAAQPEPGAFCLAQSGCLHHISDTSLSCSPLLPPVHSAPRTRRRPPADCRPPGLKPADGSAQAMPPVQKVAAAAAAGGR